MGSQNPSNRLPLPPILDKIQCELSTHDKWISTILIAHLGGRDRQLRVPPRDRQQVALSLESGSIYVIDVAR